MENIKVELIKVELIKLFKRLNVGESHGIYHSIKVLNHIEMALYYNTKYLLNNDNIDAIKYAALLHDVDDRKYSPHTELSYDNARRIMETVGINKCIISEAIEMISLVSFSKNGNSNNHMDNPWMLWVRWADRLESIGIPGIIRCWQYNCEKNKTLYCVTTPRPMTEEDVWNMATEERLNNYLRGEESKSMMDHYYDRLLHIHKPFLDGIPQNIYLEDCAKERISPLVDICLEFGKTGDDSILSLIHIHSQTTRPSSSL
tara:strand:+ start:493 stop:1269 length:777 start_codon:yes stop_codon:yes gene_type:complete